MPVPIVERSPAAAPGNSRVLQVRFFSKGGNLMKTNVNWKPQGHSAKKWQGVTPRKDPATLREARPAKKKEQFRTPMWRQPTS